MLECDATFIPLPLSWRRHFNVSIQCKGERPPFQRSVVLAMKHPGQNDASRCGRPAQLNKLPVSLRLHLRTNVYDFACTVFVAMLECDAIQ